MTSRIQYASVGTAYAAVLAISGALLFRRHLWELQNPADASGGMAAAGDTMLHLFIGFLFLVPTVMLVRVLAPSETLYSTYARFLLGLSLSAPVCVVVVLLGENPVPPSLSWLAFYRLEVSPLVLVGLGISRIAARFGRAKRLASYALLIEGLSLAACVAFFVGSIFIH